MTHYALVQNDAIVQHGALPQVWNDGSRDWDLRPMTDQQLAELGWFSVVETPRPADTADTTHDYSVELLAAVPTETWTPRPTTPDERPGSSRRRTSPRCTPSPARRSTS